jgi:hypothetical protein
MNMKRYFSILCTILPMIIMAQEEFPQLIEPGKLSVGVNFGTVYDTDFSRLNLNDLSKELSSDLSDDPSFSYLGSLNYQATPSLSFGANLGWGSIYSSNGVHYFNGDYTQGNFTTQLNIFSLSPKTIVYVGCGIGVIEYTASRSFVFDDKTFLEEEGESIKTNISCGLEYEINDKLSVVMDASYERVADDGFDAWPDETDYHKFLYTSFGLRFTLGANENKVENYRAVEEIENLLDRVELRLSKLETQEQAE